MSRGRWRLQTLRASRFPRLGLLLVAIAPGCQNAPEHADLLQKMLAEMDAWMTGKNASEESLRQARRAAESLGRAQALISSDPAG